MPLHHWLRVERGGQLRGEWEGEKDCRVIAFWSSNCNSAYETPWDFFQKAHQPVFPAPPPPLFPTENDVIPRTAWQSIIVPLKMDCQALYRILTTNTFCIITKLRENRRKKWGARFEQWKGRGSFSKRTWNCWGFCKVPSLKWKNNNEEALHCYKIGTLQYLRKKNPKILLKNEKNTF